ncbi:MAG: hypothetical protein EZS28_020940 [Streblomastix strix]|uniref:Uncharacterized protein n=1 Tax=Streblomastix strix TaxID=222440 RepID=A0A5J4VLS4_9EUKA|nr:MAG: hypothetical protein EZS28_020940 [Streblomastix strix]
MVAISSASAEPGIDVSQQQLVKQLIVESPSRLLLRLRNLAQALVDGFVACEELALICSTRIGLLLG